MESVSESERFRSGAVQNALDLNASYLNLSLFQTFKNIIGVKKLPDVLREVPQIETETNGSKICQLNVAASKEPQKAQSNCGRHLLVVPAHMAGHQVRIQQR